jgi:hypothetical protein
MPSSWCTKSLHVTLLGLPRCLPTSASQTRCAQGEFPDCASQPRYLTLDGNDQSVTFCDIQSSGREG